MYAQSTHTNLSSEEDKKTFYEVTEKIRCICLPSLPIKSCSFSNCRSSAILKDFIEDRIRKRDSAKLIVDKIINGYGEGILQDPYVKSMIQEGNGYLVAEIVKGFGPKMLAEPDPTWINLSLVAGMLVGLGVIFRYMKKRKNNSLTINSEKTQSTKEDIQKYLDEI